MTTSVEQTNNSKVSTISHHGEQRSVNASGSNFSKCEGSVSFKIKSTQGVHVHQFSQAKITVQADQKSLFHVTLKLPSVKRTKGNAGREVQDIKRNSPV